MKRRIFDLAILMAWLPGAWSLADEKTTPDYKADILPLIKSHCVDCHGPDTQEARIRLDTLSTDLINDRAAAETWHEVLNVLNAGEMPPEEATPLAAKDREQLTGWITQKIQQAVEAQRKTDGRVVLRRLNRTEYHNTMTDLLDLEMDYARDLPPDSVSPDGFKNQGESLQMSALQLEYYLATARRALDRVIVSGPAPKQYDYTFTESYRGGWLGRPHFSNRLGRQQQFLGKMAKEYPETGDFLVRVKLTADLKPDIGFPLLEVAVGYRPDTKILFREFDLVEITSAEEQTFEFRGRIENFPLPVRGQGKYPGLVVRVRNAYSDGTPLPKAEKKKDKKRGTFYPEEPHLPVIHIQSVEFHGPVFDQWPPARHRRILFDSPLRENDEAAYVTEVLRRFMSRAYRRPVEETELTRMVAFFQTIREGFPTFEEAIRETLAMVLIRPQFLYLIEPASEEKRPINDWELASRLSYFLWSTMPDEQLTKLAETGKIKDEKVLLAQVERMLNDPRASQFLNQFTDQWLQLNVLDSVAISSQHYPKFEETLKVEMQKETQQFFAELVRNNLSALNLLSSDFTMLNEPLAKHYGVEGIYGQSFRRVAVRESDHRGGLLGHASIMLSQSTGMDSHPVRRAVWIRDRLLDDPPAPPPPDVPSLDEADPKFLKLSVREQLEIHRGNGACASCHRGIDPWGIALENFDAVGLWRDEIHRNPKMKSDTIPVVAKDVLPNGVELDGPNQLKRHLLEDRKDDFARAIVTRLLQYALGRRLELADRNEVDALTKQFAQDDYRLRNLVKNIVTSPAFQTK